ncbi:MAG: hypothetical protein ABW189_03910 [Rickettsiales bacterium]
MKALARFFLLVSFICAGGAGTSYAASPADALFKEEPLATVRFYNPDVNYASAVQNALKAAASVHNGVVFVIRGTSVAGSDRSKTFVRQQAENTLLMLREMKVENGRIQTLYDVDDASPYPVLRVYVR